jgi:hypothetical protein
MDSLDLVGESICKAAKKGVEETPFTAWLPGTHHLAKDDAVLAEPRHPARDGNVRVNHLPAPIHGDKRAEVAIAHGSDERAS